MYALQLVLDMCFHQHQHDHRVFLLLDFGLYLMFTYPASRPNRLNAPGPKAVFVQRICFDTAQYHHEILYDKPMFTTITSPYIYIYNHLTWPVTSPLYHHISVISPYLAITYSMIPAFYPEYIPTASSITSHSSTIIYP